MPLNSNQQIRSAMYGEIQPVPTTQFTFTGETLILIFHWWVLRTLARSPLRYLKKNMMKTDVRDPEGKTDFHNEHTIEIGGKKEYERG